MSPTIRRLMKEAAELSSSSPSPSPHFCAHPVSDSNLFEWHFTMAGPPAPSAYAGGIYHGRIVLPPTYPLRPPSFRFLTPTGRFEVNREICLSISGHHEETWQPAWGIRTALTAIRSFMDGDAKGQLGGLDVPDDVRKKWAEKSRSWRCECMEGKTNEQVLREWQEMCAQRGISVDDEGRETVPDELRISYKKNKDTASPATTDPTENEKERPLAVLTQPGQELQAPDATVSTHVLASSAVAPSSSAEANVALQNIRGTPHTASRQPAAVPVPTPTTTATTATTTQPVQDGPWLDRAITGVLIALIFMILRRLTASEDL